MGSVCELESPLVETVQGVALYGALFFFLKKLAVSVAHMVLVPLPCLHHLVPERIPLRKLKKVFG